MHDSQSYGQVSAENSSGSCRSLFEKNSSCVGPLVVTVGEKIVSSGEQNKRWTTFDRDRTYDRVENVPESRDGSSRKLNGGWFKPVVIFLPCT